jgi:hypothetical protein
MLEGVGGRAREPLITWRRQSHSPPCQSRSSLLWPPRLMGMSRQVLHGTYTMLLEAPEGSRIPAGTFSVPQAPQSPSCVAVGLS